MKCPCGGGLNIINVSATVSRIQCDTCIAGISESTSPAKLIEIWKRMVERHDKLDVCCMLSTNLVLREDNLVRCIQCKRKQLPFGVKPEPVKANSDE